MQEEINISSNIDVSGYYMNTNKQQESVSIEGKQEMTFVSAGKKKRRKQLALKELQFNKNTSQKDESLVLSYGDHDKSYEFQRIETTQQIKDQCLTQQNSVFIQGYSQEIFHDTSINEIDLFQKNYPHHQKVKNPALKIHIKPFMKSDSSEIKSAHIPSSVSPGLKRWKKLSLIVKTVNAFQKSEIKNLEPEQIENEIKNSPSLRKKQEEQSKEYNCDPEEAMHKILDNYRRIEELCQHCQSGSPLDLERIKQILQDDPKRYMRSPDDPEHLVNKLNSQGLFPLYIACMNQNVDVILLQLNSTN